MKKYSLLLLMLFGTLLASAQETETIGDAHASNYRDWAVGVSFGQFITAGDLSTFNFNKDDVFNQFDYGIGLSVTKYLSSVWGIKGQATYGRLSGSSGMENTTLNVPTVSFESEKYFDYNLNAVINVSALALKGKKYDRKFSALVSFGIGMSQSQSTRFVNGQPVAIYAQGVGGGPDNEWTNEVFVPMDLVLKFQLSQALDLDLGAQYKYYFSDIIDALPAGISNDAVVYPHVGLTYNFGKKEAGSVIYTNPLDEMYFDIAEVKENFDMLTTDDDKDGVNNLFDKDNSTPEGVVVDGSGRALDVDQDGIPDNMDEDPFTGKGAKVDAQGRAVDSDGDGVPDYLDKEPNTPAGTVVNFQGKELTSGGFSDAYTPPIFFGFNSASIDNANHYRMASVARILKANKGTKVTLVGYADKRGSEEYNKNLAMRRAEAVKKQLVQVYGVDEGRITTTSEGESDPLADGRYDVNRRVDVLLK